MNNKSVGHLQFDKALLRARQSKYYYPHFIKEEA